MSEIKLATKRKNRVIADIIAVVFVVSAVMGLAGCNKNEIITKTAYQVVTLDNGLIYFGKIGEMGTDFLVLTDVYSGQQKMSEDKKEIQVNLTPRSSDLHNPDFMQINIRHIVYIEPIKPDSRLAAIIQKAKKELQAAAVPNAGKTSDAKNTKEGK